LGEADVHHVGESFKAIIHLYPDRCFLPTEYYWFLWTYLGGVHINNVVNNVPLMYKEMRASFFLTSSTTYFYH